MCNKLKAHMPRFIGPVNACKLCNCTSLDGLVNNAHTLCAARAKRNRPTPPLGSVCECCQGEGCHPHSSIGPMNPNKAMMEAWAPNEPLQGVCLKWQS